MSDRSNPPSLQKGSQEEEKATASREPQPGPSTGTEAAPSVTDREAPGASSSGEPQSSPSRIPHIFISREPQPAPSRASQPGPSREPRPGPSREPRPGPSREPRLGHSREPQPGPSWEPQPGPSWEPQPGPSWASQPGPSWASQPGPSWANQPRELASPGPHPTAANSNSPDDSETNDGISRSRTYAFLRDDNSVSSSTSSLTPQMCVKTSVYNVFEELPLDNFPRGFFCGTSRNIGWFFALLSTSALCVAYYSVIGSDILCTQEYDGFCQTSKICSVILACMYVLCFLVTRFTLPPLIPGKLKMNFAERRTTDYYIQHFGTNSARAKMSSLAIKRNINFRSMIGDVLFCNECRIVKPDRTQHCPICQVCVIRMDHHCRFFGNCIHLRNYKAYVLTMFYSAAFTGYIIFSTMAAGFVSPDALMSKPYVYRSHVVSAMLGFSIIQFVVSMISFLSTMREAARNNTASGKDCRVLCANNETYSYDLNNTFFNLREAFASEWFFWAIPFPEFPYPEQLVFFLRKD